MRNIDSLKNTSEFKEVYEKGTSKANKLLVLYVLEKEGGKASFLPDENTKVESLSENYGFDTQVLFEQID